MHFMIAVNLLGYFLLFSCRIRLTCVFLGLRVRDINFEWTKYESEVRNYVRKIKFKHYVWFLVVSKSFAKISAEKN
jgi:hypothetical protein